MCWGWMSVRLSLTFDLPKAIVSDPIYFFGTLRSASILEWIYLPTPFRTIFL